MNQFILSLKKNYKGILIIIAASLLTSIGQLLWKLSNGSNLSLILFGFICYGLGAVLMIIAFRFGRFSVIHPMISFGYIFAIVFGAIVLKEKVTFMKLLGVSIIMVGVLLIGGGDE